MLCELLGKSKQAFYKGNTDQPLVDEVKEQIALDFARAVRKKDPMIGVVKIWYMYTKEQPEELRIGRDRFIRIMAENNLRVRRRQFKPRTTDSRHNLPLYPNLVKALIPQRPNQLWVSDITYWPTGLVVDEKKFYYISIITDAYTHEIVSYELSRTLSTVAPLKALKTALRTLPEKPKELIHHSDRGVQYASLEYTKELKKHGIHISMTECGDPKENPVAERINETLKNEILGGKPAGTFVQALRKLAAAVQFYNKERPHMSCDMLTPEETAQRTGPLKKQWHSYREEYIKQENDEASAA